LNPSGIVPIITNPYFSQSLTAPLFVLTTILN